MRIYFAVWGILCTFVLVINIINVLIMQETPLFTIRYHLTGDLVFDYTKLLPSYKKQLKIWRIVSVCSVILIIANFILSGSDVNWIVQGIFMFLVVESFLLPLMLKRNVKKQFQESPTNNNEYVMMIYEDRLEVLDKGNNSSSQFAGMDHIEETAMGVHVFLTEVQAISIPREAVSEQALEFLKKKIG